MYRRFIAPARSFAATVALVALVGIGLSTSTLPASAAAATTPSVCPTGCGSTTIQGAIDAAVSGDTITVAAGTYSEEGIVVINKDGLILQGVQAEVDARSHSGAETVISGGQFRLEANNITIDGFTLTASEDTPEGRSAAAIYGAGSSSGTQILNNIIENSKVGAQFNNAGEATTAALIENNIFRNNAGGGLWILGDAPWSTNVSIVDNDFSGHPSTAINVIGHNVLISGNTSTGDSNLVVLTNSTDVEITANTMTDATGSGIFLGLGNDGVTITDNKLGSNAVSTDNLAAIRISNAFGTGVSQNYTITGNQITGGWKHAIRSSVNAYDGILAPRDNQFGMVVTNGETDQAKAIDASGNWWDPAIDLNTMSNVVADSACVNVDCEPSVTTLTVTVLPSGSALTGTAVTITGTVSPATAAGTIAIFDGTTSLGEGTATGGVFTVVTSALAVGSHSLTAKFTPPDNNVENYLASASTAVMFSVNEKELPSEPPSTNTDQLEVFIETHDLDVSGTTDSFVPSAETVGNALDSLDASKTFSGTLPWPDRADSFVDVYAYSSPVFLGTFPVVNGKVQITGVDLSALAAGGHHLVFVGQTSGTVSVMAIVVAKGLAVTGVDPAVPIGAAGILLLLGLGLLIVVADRRLA